MFAQLKAYFIFLYGVFFFFIFLLVFVFFIVAFAASVAAVVALFAVQFAYVLPSTRITYDYLRFLFIHTVNELKV